ncbi:methionyl-tRNA formyltransferase, partial [Candidatus Uhrbacteria bacterium]|nr:methionyl-tRNA formyltransferase [Candidatus Uhrbacteria bacterium]
GDHEGRGEAEGDANMKRILFLGTSEFAVPSLRVLLDDTRFDIVGVVTQPDRPVGRHAIITPPPIKTLAVEHDIPVFQPEKMKDLKEDATFLSLMDPRPDAFVVVSYGKILPQWSLDLPAKGIVNVHGSILPRWRGASPIQAAIAAGDAVTGVTVMKIDAELDHGPILAAREESILSDDTGATLHDRLADIGGAMLPDVLAGYLDDAIAPVEQDHTKATACRTLTRDDGKIDWTKNAVEIERLVRAYTPWPGTWTLVDGKRLKILAARVADPEPTKKPGDLFVSDAVIASSTKQSPSRRLLISCADASALELVTVQPEGGKPMSGAAYAASR